MNHILYQGANPPDLGAPPAPSEVAKNLDRGELYVHMNGAIPAATIHKILRDEATPLPAGFVIEEDLLRTSPCTSLATYLRPWQLLRLLPKKRENLDVIAQAVIASLAGNGIRFVEIRSSVLYLATLQRCSATQALERLIEATRNAAERYGMRRGLIMTVTRGDYAAVSLATLPQAYQDLGEPDDVIGIDVEAPAPKRGDSTFIRRYVDIEVQGGL